MLEVSSVVFMIWGGPGAVTQSPITLSLRTSHSVSTLVIIPSSQPAPMWNVLSSLSNSCAFGSFSSYARFLHFHLKSQCS